ncbi:MAG: hypothetical protein HUJ51_01925 [Eggerthellaceae bacterium]|nr:hypothetical protein [Eggerthellaceae bacterium]
MNSMNINFDFSSKVIKKDLIHTPYLHKIIVQIGMQKNAMMSIEFYYYAIYEKAELRMIGSGFT